MPGSTEAFTAAGAKIYMSAALPTTLTKTAYGTLTWTEVGEVTDGGAIGRVYKMVTHSPLGARGDVKLKGSYNDGDPSIKAAYAPGDAGQLLVQTALNDDAFYSIKHLLQDGTIIYSQAQVTSAPVEIGTVDTVVGTTIGLATKSGTIVFSYPA